MTLKQLRELFFQMWPYPSGKRAVFAGYQALRSYPHLLADIALRNYVFADAPRAASVFDAGVAEGRRQAALEIIRLARLDPALLWDVIEARPHQREGSRT